MKFRIWSRNWGKKMRLSTGWKGERRKSSLVDDILSWWYNLNHIYRIAVGHLRLIVIFVI